MQPASPEILVREFHEQKKLPATDFKLCAAFQGPRADLFDPESSQARLMITPSRERKSLRDENAIKVDVALVTVPATVADAGGKYLPDLDITDFHVFEDNAEQKIDRLITASEPWNVVLMLDASGSTRFKNEEIQNAALAFVRALRPQDHLMIVSLGSRIYLDSELTGDHNQLTRAIFSPRVEGSTRLYDAVDLVLTERLNRISGRKAIILFTDGVDTGSRLVSAADSLAGIQESEVLVYVIQYNTAKENKRQLPWNAHPGAAPEGVFDNREIYARATQHLQDLSDGTGGRLDRAETVTDLDDAFTNIAEQLRHQYTLSYYSSNPKRGGSYRHIRVSVDMPGVTIRARTGYRAGGKPSTNN